MGKIIVMGSLKDGVDKTTITLNRAYVLSKMGRSVIQR